MIFEDFLGSSQQGGTPALVYEKNSEKQNPEYWTKSQIGPNPEFDKIHNGQNPKLDKIPNWIKTRMEKIQN